jgi:hypothetical protein
MMYLEKTGRRVLICGLVCIVIATIVHWVTQ